MLAAKPQAKKQTPYFLFCLDNRDAAREEYIQAGLSKPTGADVAKVLGQKWKNLTEEEKASYKNKCNRLKEEYAEEQRERAERGEDGDGEEDDGTGKDLGLHLPLTRIKRIMRSDKDVSLVHVDTLKLITKATELLIEMLIEGADNECRSKKRKTIMFSDIEAAVSHDGRLSNILFGHIWASRPQKIWRSKGERGEKCEGEEGDKGEGSGPQASSPISGDKIEHEEELNTGNKTPQDEHSSQQRAGSLEDPESVKAEGTEGNIESEAEISESGDLMDVEEGVGGCIQSDVGEGMQSSLQGGVQGADDCSDEEELHIME